MSKGCCRKAGWGHSGMSTLQAYLQIDQCICFKNQKILSFENYEKWPKCQITKKKDLF